MPDGARFPYWAWGLMDRVSLVRMDQEWGGRKAGS